MVVAVWGKIDGNDVVFSRGEGDKWNATIPLSTAGQFVVELWAEDDAGNRAFFARVLVTFDPLTLKMSFSVLSVGASFSADDIHSIFGTSPVSGATKNSDVRGSFSNDGIINSVFQKGGDC